MNKEQIANLVNEKHATLYAWLAEHDIQKWEQGPDGKWTTGQHVKHLVQSLRPLNKVLRLPKFFLKYKFGVSNRNTRSYDEVVAKYQSKVVKVPPGFVSPFSKEMTIPTSSEKESLIKTLDTEKDVMLNKMSKWKAGDLDKYIVPHPLLGRMPMREMFMFMGYHTEHHYKILEEKY